MLASENVSRRLARAGWHPLDCPIKLDKLALFAKLTIARIDNVLCCYVFFVIVVCAAVVAVAMYVSVR